jgi:hypothetical protein
MLDARMDRRWIGLVALVAALSACKTQSHRLPADLPGAAIDVPPSPSASACAPVPAPSASALPAAASASGAAPAGTPGPVAPPAPSGPPGDACRTTRGPVQLSFTGPVTFVTGDGELRIVQNRDGVPIAAVLPAAKKPDPAPGVQGGKPAEAKKPERLALAEPAERLLVQGCAAAGDALFCVDKGGGIHRSGPAGEGSRVVAQARAGSPVAAASFGASHVVYAFLADRKTQEGAMTLAFAALDDATPILLSEDGCGATAVTLASRGEEAIALYVDARRVLTPVHARVLTGAVKLGLGPDAVVFVGNGGDARTPGVIAQGGAGHELALVAIDRDDKDFGMAAIRIEEQPRDDAAVTWGLYPAAMERPAIAATQGAWPIRVIRSRPADADPKAKKVLELGELDAAGVHKTLCSVATSASFADLAIAADRTGALWIAYTDADGTWVEKRGK